jgi:cell division protein ZipA
VRGVNELRWVLALLGVLFIAGLFLWERRKQRALLPSARPLAGLEPELPSVAAEEGSTWSAAVRREPPLVLPEIRAREPAQPLPVIELPDADGYAHSEASFVVECPSAEEGPTVETPAEEGEAALAPRPDPAALRLEWAEEVDRQIICARVVPAAERFAGRTVRQALAGEGFVHGPLGIFHRALPDGRVVLSCASLTKPGSFDLGLMDTQRFAGLNLFAVLPGPVPPGSALEDLVTVSRTLAARLGGVVQDDRGQPLDVTRIAELKAALAPRSTFAPRPPPPFSGAAGERAP